MAITDLVAIILDDIRIGLAYKKLKYFKFL